jgi:hypothetical protein
MPHYRKGRLTGVPSCIVQFFEIPNQSAFDSVNQEGGRAIRGSTGMGFLLDLKKCLD